MPPPAHTAAPSIDLVRVEYVNPYISALRQLGVPVERELRKAKLPPLIEEISGEYVSTHLGYRCLMSCIEAEGIEDLGFMIGWELTVDDLSSGTIRSLDAAPTLKCALDTFARLAPIEDSALRCCLRHHGNSARFAIHQIIPEHGDSRISEWPNLKMVIEIIRRHAGPNWLPPVIGLQSPRPVWQEIEERLDSVAILTGQPLPYVQFSAELLALPPRRSRLSMSQHATDVGNPLASEPRSHGDDLINQLRQALVPYLASHHPSIDLAAEIAGVSIRSLQRSLAARQTSYSEIIETVRFERALYLLRHSQQRILDIALSLGYRDASNFARAIRRISGSSPGELRRDFPSGNA